MLTSAERSADRCMRHLLLVLALSLPKPSASA